ncbi:hypothetical protein [Sulfuricurvum sp.]
MSNRIAWPDGKSRLYQYVKLAEAFDLLDGFVYEEMSHEPKGTGNT